MIKIKILTDVSSWKVEELFDGFVQNELGEENLIHEIIYRTNNTHDVHSVLVLYSSPEYSNYKKGRNG